MPKNNKEIEKCDPKTKVWAASVPAETLKKIVECGAVKYQCLAEDTKNALKQVGYIPQAEAAPEPIEQVKETATTSKPEQAPDNSGDDDAPQVMVYLLRRAKDIPAEEPK